MRTPIRPLPDAIQRWASRVRYLRWLDALVAGLVVWGLLAAAVPGLRVGDRAVVALTLLGLLAPVHPLRVRWRPVSAWVALSMSRAIGPGDRAWYVRSGEAMLVLVTARRRLRVTMVTGTPDAAEGLSVRRSRVLLIPADPARARR